jgi:heterodisulfide reductase subunit A-like polyferredoxin
MQAALDLADQGFQVALVEREPSIGGKMITLSKVFPTLDCCSCITTPKMSAAAHHPGIRSGKRLELASFRPMQAALRGLRQVHRMPQV